MLDPKVLNLLEMAERGELPESVYSPHPNIAMTDHMIYGGKLCKKGADMLAEHRRETTKSDLTAIHSQLGELKYKVEKLESFTKPFTCSCTKSEQPELEWEVWWKPCEKLICVVQSEEEAKIIIEDRSAGRGNDATGYEVRHNPKRKYTNESDQLREKLSEIGEQIVDLGKTIQTL